MKKRGSGRRFLMWVMVIWLHAHLSIAAELSKSNDTDTASESSVCDGSVEDCLNNVHRLDSELLPTISSSHFRRILAGGANKVVFDTLKSAAFLCTTINGYRRCGARVPPGGIPNRCANKGSFLRNCHKIDR
ncbi:hypothetical protein AAZX31_08G243000 [Glycine max]|uniref:Uncharacterized protein n=2 Tax=Glycine subgen. Soja TaxID=1462606 RepID=I1KWH2_SOYBN|nr:uncharacterized protein LOC100780709 [Glycine max]XP_028246861.1 uncharacterized protein LOC114424209 [Glycine soja]KAG5026475.1 hypothetical protein JHK86_022389 [Glycine max]KAH1052972.1 hypothetical protein GYH30_022319 [Glycine max]KHN30331.1 hypothetical protein glysoja_037842 [Glycine soja]KRH45077.1 hypothetical protein GLYMA_08G249100v4 [Glycine max]RZB98690.1 hypothetical protein D0Y65_021543 [Glycine soja]|eukprot:XP_003531867.1 uncharacterized protein LOC100780709 [Glycine max]